MSVAASVRDCLAGGPFDARRLEQVFAECFEQSENTRLIGGADEPLYLPTNAAQAHARLFYREDFFASALHETAHWCIAGSLRRRQRDFGYWYAPEGRGAAEQRAFLQVEARPQALEWCFAAACGYRFRLSLDDFAAVADAAEATDFARRVVAEAQRFQQRGLPERAGRFFDALACEFGTGASLGELAFNSADCKW